jgi:hypothetical protein
MFRFCAQGIVIFILLLSAVTAVWAQEPPLPILDTSSYAFQNVQEIITSSMEEIETHIAEKGAVAPFAVIMLPDLSLEEISIKGSKQHNTITALQEALSIPALKGEYLAIVIFYTDTVVNATTGDLEPTLVAIMEHSEDDIAYTFYYPYTLKDKNVIWSESYGEPAHQVIFKP